MKNLPISLETDSNYLNLTRKNRGVRKRHRTHFTPQQVEKLEEIFTQQTSSPYRELILQLSTTLNLTDKNIAIWFKNRRAKERKQQNETGGKAIQNKVSKELSSTQQTEAREITSESQQHSRDATCHYRPQISNYTPHQPWNNFVSNRPEYQPYYTQSGRRLPQNNSYGYQNPHLSYQNPHYGYSRAQNGYPVNNFTAQLPTARNLDSYTTSSTTSSNTVEISGYPTAIKQVSSFPEISSYTTVKQDLSSNTPSQYGSPFQQPQYNFYPKFESATPIVEKQRNSPVHNSTGSSPNHQSFDSTNSVSSLPKELIDFITTETLQNSSGQSSLSPISSAGSDDQNTSTVSFNDYNFPSLQNLSP
ncbi:hypothetical protein LOTGIDRAFT_157874 [Lottia gigantea]|uniref:Homeobox domain-containing protein n=1 Tax=Lottia gigantea TaxID=225164 RepID=V4CF21_LOTGI|nr:hypothetical protein LOTGIDRAFT_157874 [Lottia gigantea]ESP00595.1 hypothetical protein LOTGIDRAFT_157874 [Lottia gigantea]